MSSDIVCRISHLGKCFRLYEKPVYRLYQMFLRHRQFYKAFWALDDVSFEVKRNEAIGIVGRNGSGKSTLLHLLCGTAIPSTGSISTQGKIAALLELGTGFNNEFTGKENVFLTAALYGLSDAEIKQRYASIVEFADIGDFIDSPVKTYSSGMVVRLAFSIIAHIDADILVVDEALSVGDAVFSQKCMRFLRQFREKGTLIFISHDMGAVLSLCSRAIWLNQGKLMMDGLPSDVMDAYLAYLFESQQGPSDSQFQSKLTIARQDNVENKKLSVAFGIGNAVIQSVWLEDNHGVKLQQVTGGEAVHLCVSVLIKKEILLPIIGFHFKDRLGQIVFGDNTYLTYRASPPAFSEGTMAVARFSFTMPFLKSGLYVIGVAIAEGTQENHVQHHWVYEALIVEYFSNFKFERFVEGILDVPMGSIQLGVATQNVAYQPDKEVEFYD